MIHLFIFVNASNPNDRVKVQLSEVWQRPNLINKIISKVGGYITPKMFGAKSVSPCASIAFVFVVIYKIMDTFVFSS